MPHPANSAMAQAITLIAIFVAGMGEAALVGRSEGKLAAECRFFCERSARPRSAVNLARGRGPPLAAVRPRLLRTGRGDRRRSGGLERGANGEPIALGSGRGGGIGVRLGIGGDGGGRRGAGLYLRIGGERRHHGSPDCKRGHASCELGDGHLTTHPAAPVASETRSGVLRLSRGGATKGSRSRARFSAIFTPKCRIRREWRAKAQPSERLAADQHS